MCLGGKFEDLFFNQVSNRTNSKQEKITIPCLPIFPPFQFSMINHSEKNSLKNMAGYKRELENKTSNDTSSSKKPRGLMRRWGIMNLYYWRTFYQKWCLKLLHFENTRPCGIFSLLLFLPLQSAVWQYGLWSFQTGGTKVERFLLKNPNTQRKLLNFENWVNGEVSKNWHHFSK